MLLRLILLFTIVPLLELMLLLRVADAWSWQATLALVLLTGIVGAWLARREGLRALRRIQDEFNAGAMPTKAVFDAVLILAAGLMLVTPGFITDAVGLSMLIPPVRRWVGRRIRRAYRHKVVVMHHDVESDFVDVEATVVDNGEADSNENQQLESASTRTSESS